MLFERCQIVNFLEISVSNSSREGNFYNYYRVLYVWHMRHPASGYVQGINDVVTPFVLVFLSDYLTIDFDTLNVP